jgi:hypothetical protein
MGKRHLVAALLLLSAFGLWCAAPASATGTVRVTQSDGTVRNYHDVTIHFKNDRLRLISADRKGTLIIDRAACSYIGEIERCLPIDAQLDQSGSVRPLDFDYGTIFVNPSSDVQTLPHSTTQLQPNGIILFLKTKHGTYVSAHGEIDEVQH